MQGHTNEGVIQQASVEMLAEVRRKVRAYIVDNLLLGAAQDLDDTVSLLECGILDSTGAMELVGFLEDVFMVEIADKEIIPDNLDSVDRICALIERKRSC